MVRAGRVDAVLIGDHLPKLGTDLVAALAGLDVDEFPHGVWCVVVKRRLLEEGNAVTRLVMVVAHVIGWCAVLKNAAVVVRGAERAHSAKIREGARTRA